VLRTWIGLAAFVTLTACDGAMPSFNLLKRPFEDTGSKAVGQTSISVTDRKVALTAPDGFCVDPESTRNGAAQAFVVFGNCAAITENPEQPQPFVQAVVTATVTGSGLTGDGAVAGRADGLIEFFRSTEGRAALSRSADPDSVSVASAFEEDGAVFLRLEDRSEGALAGTQDSYWRGYFDAGQSVVAMSVLGLTDAPITDAEGLSLLRNFIERSAAPVPVEAQAILGPGQPVPPSPGTTERKGILDRLFR
jgi:hypothetical protein